MQLKVSAISKGKVRFLNLRGDFVLKTRTRSSAQYECKILEDPGHPFI